MLNRTRERFWAILLLTAAGASGCATMGPAPLVYQNPAPLPAINRDFLWDQLVDVVDDYFEIEREDRVRQVGDVLTVGRIDTFPVVGSTILEPIGGNTVTLYDMMEGTFQSLRRRAVVQVVPSNDGYLLDVQVFKELEDVPKPEYATAGGATFRHDSTQRHDPEPVGQQAANLGWIPQGRDPALEQRIISKVMERIGAGPGYGVH